MASIPAGSEGAQPPQDESMNHPVTPYGSNAPDGEPGGASPPQRGEHPWGSEGAQPPHPEQLTSSGDAVRHAAVSRTPPPPGPAAERSPGRDDPCPSIAARLLDRLRGEHPRRRPLPTLPAPVQRAARRAARRGAGPRHPPRPVRPAPARAPGTPHPPAPLRPRRQRLDGRPPADGPRQGHRAGPPARRLPPARSGGADRLRRRRGPPHPAPHQQRRPGAAPPLAPLRWGAHAPRRRARPGPPDHLPPGQGQVQGRRRRRPCAPHAAARPGHRRPGQFRSPRSRPLGRRPRRRPAGAPGRDRLGPGRHGRAGLPPGAQPGPGRRPGGAPVAPWPR